MDSHAATADAGGPRRPRRGRSLLAWLLVLIGLGLLGWLAWYLLHRPEEAAPGARRGPVPTTVGVATVERANIPISIEALGTVTASAVAVVRPQVAGVLKEVHFSEGQVVKAGQLLAVIDPRPFEMALMQATGQRQRDEAQLENARLTLQRFRTLLAQDSIARQEVDTQAALVKQLEGTVAIGRAAEGTARLNLSYTRITAPITGRVGLRAVDVGNLVSASDASGIADITQVNPIDVEFALPQDLVPELRVRLNQNAGLPVTVLDRGRQRVLDTGRFLALDNQVDTQTGTVRAKGRFANPESTLFPSQFVNVRLLLRTVEDALVVPVNAVRFGGNREFVYVLNPAERTVSLRDIRRGQAAGDKVQILEGLQAGERVITEGADRLKDGAKVTLPGERGRTPGMDGGAGAAGTGPGKGERSAKGGPGGSDSAAKGPGRPQGEAPPAAGAPARPPAAGGGGGGAGG